MENQQKLGRWTKFKQQTEFFFLQTLTIWSLDMDVLWEYHGMFNQQFDIDWINCPKNLGFTGNSNAIFCMLYMMINYGINQRIFTRGVSPMGVLKKMPTTIGM